MPESIESTIVRMLGLDKARTVVTAKHVKALAEVLQARENNAVTVARSQS